MSQHQTSSNQIDEQDSLDNIIVEDDYNHQEDIDSMKSFSSSFDVEGDDQHEHEDEELEGDIVDEENYSKDQLEEQEGDEDEDNSLEENDQAQDEAANSVNQTALIMKKIQEKKRSIFQLVHRTQLSLIVEHKSSTSQAKKRTQGTNNGQNVSKMFSNGEFGSNQILKREILNYSRREKSLEELSKKFLSLFLDKEESMLSLDKITNQLGVERRRIYDIINILESLKLVSRKGKNNYKWNGFQKIYETISQFDSKTLTKKEEQELTQEPQKREKSLEMLSIGFLKLFLHWKCTMTLEEAARKLSSKQIDDHKIKTKIRRLYDIANVFKSLGLIKKTSLIETKKPAFEWIGIVGLDSFAYKIMKEKKTGIEEKESSATEEEINNNNLSSSQQNQLNEPKLSKKRFSNEKNTIKTITSNGSLNGGEKQQLKKSFIIQQQLREQKEKERLQNEQSQQDQQQQNQQQSIEQTLYSNKENINPNAFNFNQLLSTLQKNISSQSLLQQQQQQQQQQSNFQQVQQPSLPALNQAQLQLLSRPLLQILTNNINNSLNCNNNNNNNNQQIIKTQEENLKQNSNSNTNGNNLIGNLMLKCVSNILTNFVNKNSNNNSNTLQNKQFSNQELFLAKEEQQQNMIENLAQESPEKVFKLNQSMNNQNSAFLNNQQWSSNSKLNASNNKYQFSSQKSSSNLADFTTAKKQKNDTTQMINDENVPLSGEKYQGSNSQVHAQNTSNLKTPILKRTLTIIQPKLDENEDITPTPPTCKRSFSACYSSGNQNNSNNAMNAANLFQNCNQQIGAQQNQTYAGLFTDKTTQYLQKMQNNLNQQQQQQASSSSFKKIRKLTYENISLSGSDNKQNEFELKKSCSFDNQMSFNSLIQNSQSLLKNHSFQMNLNQQSSSNNMNRNINNNNNNENNQLLSNINLNQLSVLQNKRVLEHYF